MALNIPGLFGPQQPMQGADPRAREMQLAQMDPQQQVAASRIMGAGNAARGVANLVGAAVGQENPQQKAQRVRQRVAAALQGQDMTDPDKVYPILIRELQAAGMVQEAMQAADEYRGIQRQKAQDERADRTQARLEKKDENDARIRDRANELRNPDSALERQIARLLQLRTQRDATAEGTQERKNLDDAIRMLESNLDKSKGVTVTPRGEIIDKDTGEVIRGEQGASADARLRADTQLEIARMRQAQAEAKRAAEASGRDSAVAESIPALEAAVEAVDRLLRNDRFALYGPAAATSPREAWTVHNEMDAIKGRVFLDELAKLKSSGKGSGLGALSDAEGQRIVSAQGQLKFGTTSESLKHTLTGIRASFQRVLDKAREVAGRPSAGGSAPSGTVQPGTQPIAPALPAGIRVTRIN